MTYTAGIPRGYCQCGCGEKTRIARCDEKTSPVRKGEPYLYVRNHRHHRTDPEYILDEESGCWEWNRWRYRNGYGGHGRHQLAHRVYYERFKGPIPDGLEIHHICNNHGCVNPDHLEAVPHSSNSWVATKYRKTRPHSPFTEEHIRAILLTWESEDWPTMRFCKRIGDLYGVTWSCIQHIIHRRTWADVDPLASP